MFPRLLCATLACGLALGAFAASGPVAPDLTLEPPNLSTHKQQLKAYLDSGGYAKGVAQVALEAVKYLQKRIPKGAKGKKMAVVFDIDETTLSNVTHIVAHDFGYIPKDWDEWIAAGHAPAIVPVQTVYDVAVRAQIDVFFLTGRPEAARASTERNLREVGYDTWARIYFKPTTDPTLTTAGFKTEVRRQLTKDGYVIIANVGDQNSDLVNGYAEKIFKLPNPFYYSR